MSDFFGMIIQGVGVLCDYIVKLESLEVEKLKILKDAELMERKISVTEKVALERLANQKLVLQRSLDMTAEELGSIRASKEILFKAVDRLVQNIISDHATVATQELSLKAMGLIQDEIQKLREDTNVQFETIAANVQKALENPLNQGFLDGGVA